MTDMYSLSSGRHPRNMQALANYAALKQNKKSTLPPLKGVEPASPFTYDIKTLHRTVLKDGHSKHPPRVLPVLFFNPDQSRMDGPKTRGRHKKKSPYNIGESGEHQDKKDKSRCEKNISSTGTKQIVPEFAEYRDPTRVIPKWSSSKLPAINFSVYKLLRKKIFEERISPGSSFGELLTLTGHLNHKTSFVKISTCRKSTHMDFWRNPDFVKKSELFGPIFTQTGQNEKGLKSATKYNDGRISTPIPKFKHAHSESPFFLRHENGNDQSTEALRLPCVSARRKRTRRQAKRSKRCQLPELQDGRLESVESRLSTPQTPASSVLSNFRYFNKMKSLVGNGARDDVSKIASFLERTSLIEAQLRKKKLENLRKYFLKNETLKGGSENDDEIRLRPSEKNKTIAEFSVPKNKPSVSEVSDRPVKFYQTFRKERANDKWNLTESKVPASEKRRQSTASSIKSDAPITGLCKVVFRVRNEKGVMVIAAEEVNEAVAV